MCGIAGTTSPDPGVLLDAMAALGHRGPDASGFWMDDAIGLVHTRLAVQDVSARASQPMVSDCGRWVLAYNGEVYNFPDLRRGLERQGVRFRSDGDTEVVLALFARDGIAAVHKLVGMFALAIWDRQRNELLLVRDRLGIKPLVYAGLPGGGIAFASEIAALRRVPGLDLAIDQAALSEYLACLYVPAPRTIHKGIKKLPPGHLLRWRNGNIALEPYWAPAVVGGAPVDVADAAREMLELLREAVAGRMIADVPVGCFLSGGIDSSVIAALMAERARAIGAPPPKSFTMTFEQAAYDERDAACGVAAHLGLEHRELPASPGLATRLADSLGSFGEPFGNPTSLLVDELSRQARGHVTVALAGDGGDEVFAGYPRYQGGVLAGRYRQWLPSWLRQGVIGPLAALIPESSRGRHGPRRLRAFLRGANLADADMYASWVEYFSPADRRQLLGLDRDPPRPIAGLYRQAPSQTPLDAMQQTDLLSFLPGNLLAYGDAMSMRHALELRLPLIDHRIVEAAGRLPAGLRLQGGLKTVLRAVAGPLLPAAIASAPKRGFNPPLGVWLKDDLGDMVGDLLTPRHLAEAGIQWAPVERLLAEQRRGFRDHALKVWSLLALVAWKQGLSR